MTSPLPNILSSEDVSFLNEHPEVLTAKARLREGSNTVYFTIPLTDSIRSALTTRFGLDFSRVSEIPMRWIQGDTAPHVDVGRSEFENTYLVYLNDSPGELLLGDVAYPIEANSGFVFQEGLSHKTQNTGTAPRLVLGPMNELAQPVGAPAGLYYYTNQSDAQNTINSIAFNFVPNYVVGSIDSGSIAPITSWRLAASSSGSSSQAIVYVNGMTLNNDGNTAVYHLYPAIPCFLEGTTILCQVEGKDAYLPIEQLQKGTLVKTSRDGYKPVAAIAKGTIQNPGNVERIENRLYKCCTEKYPELKTDLYITGCHSILVDTITDAQRADTIKHLGRIFVTDRKYRLMACVDERAEPWNSEGIYTIWHFALDSVDDGINFGVYANGGLLVETCSLRFLKNKSNMTLQ